MSQHVIKVPDVGEGVAEVELVAWTVEVGDQVVRNQVLAEVMTDKANVEIPAPVDGVIAGLTGDVGEIVAVGTDLIRIATGDQASASPTASAASPVPGPAPEPAPVGPEPTPGRVNPFADRSPAPPSSGTPGAATPAQPVSAVDSEPDLGPEPPVTAGDTALSVDTAIAAPSYASADVAADATPSATAAGPVATDGVGARTRATPAVRARARRLGLDLDTIVGTGPDHRITHDDLDDRLLGGTTAVVTPAGASPPPAGAPSSPTPVPAPTATQAVALPEAPGAAAGDVRPLVGLRRQIAQRMVTATTTIPHITFVDEVDVTAVEELRATVNADAPDGPKLTLLPFLIKAVVAAVAEHPGLNAHVDDEAGTHIVFDTVDVGIATQTDRGLLVPVVRNAAPRSLWELAAEVGRLAAAARDRSIEASALSGSTITISSLGALGGLVTTPVINKPEVAIIGVNKIATRPVWDGNGFVPRRLMNLSSSFDHRVIDGYDAAAFIGEVRRRLEQPALLFGADTRPRS